MPPIPVAAPSATAGSATLPAQSLPPVPRIALDAATLGRISPPVKRINSDSDTLLWISSEARGIYSLFVQRIAEACVGKPTRPLPPRPASAAHSIDAQEPMERLLQFVRHIDAWTDEIEPQSKPQRFGNLAFRDWGARLEERADELHRQLLPLHLHAFIPELSPYLVESFGSFVRIDYGSGHEFCFAAWLCFLYRLGFFEAGKDDGDDGGSSSHQMWPPTQIEERLGLEAFPLYLDTVWRLQDRYGLEPAGSHGVWGLDDYQFLPYVLGAAQLRSQSTLRPSQIVVASAHPQLLGSLPDKTPSTLISHPPTIPSALLAPASSSASSASDETPLPNLYLTSLLRIQVLKRGPFHEHSPLLHDISTSVPNFIKTYTGMVKMYEAECLDKRVVVQHFKFGGVGFVWDPSGARSGHSSSIASFEASAASGSAHPTAAASLGMVRGNASSMGVPTTRMTAPAPQSAAATRMPPSLMPASATRAPFARPPASTGVPPSTSMPSGRTTVPTATMPPPPQPGARPGQSKTTGSGREGHAAAAPTPTPRPTPSSMQPTRTSAVGSAAQPTPAPTARPVTGGATPASATSASQPGPTPTSTQRPT
ncbi:related to RRD1 - Resistant to Rapamycin Deletion (protein phosphatase 2A regulator activity) [Pseudozyma flocculosa]|uniref:Serine/threonine-protein phosphatase 2A activator n=1 Tax=Pseudozyma flocculosa TaxID=84751 RepID=A0A5C3FE37_9BASI|nr:related to RRD1 - Resistant to Rapamycin Deletion (protein phosphatase 2A regulator activity) [Pseudozyma flocculosa]